MSNELTQQILHELLEDHNGYLFWKNPKTSRTTQKANRPIGSICKDGYTRVSINRKTYNVARIVWIYHNGDIPDGLTIDHKDRNRSNNLIENLTTATRAEQLQNRRVQLPTYITETPRGWSVKIKLNESECFQKTYKRRSEILEDQDYFLALCKKINHPTMPKHYYADHDTFAHTIAEKLIIFK